MKRILIAFDGSYYAESVIQHGLDISNATGAQIAGLFIEDLDFLDNNLFLPRPEMSTAVLDEEILTELRKDNQERIATNIKLFQRYCSEHDVDYLLLHEKGAAVEQLLEESRFADLLIIGYSAYFWNVEHMNNTNLVQELLTEAQCPVLVVPEKYEPTENILLAFDGQESSLFAIKQFIYAMETFSARKQVHLVTVSESAEKSVADKDKLLEFITLYCPRVESVHLIGKPDEELMHFAATVPSPLLVLGAFGRSAVSRFFKKSIGERVMESKVIPAFITHK